MLQRIHLACVLVCGAACLSACDEKLSTLAGPTPSLEPTFASIQHEIFEQSDSSGRSACVKCHVTGGTAAFTRLLLTHDVAYDNLVNVRSFFRPAALRVVPGDPENSYLIHKLEGLPDIALLRMPQDGPPYLTDGQVLIIKRWIANGAPRN